MASTVQPDPTSYISKPYHPSSKEVQRKLRDLEVVFPEAIDPPICWFGKHDRTTRKVDPKQAKL